MSKYARPNYDVIVSKLHLRVANTHFLEGFVTLRSCCSFPCVILCWAMEDYNKCKLSGGGSPRHLNTFSNLFLLLYTTHISTHYVCIVAIVAVHYTHQYTLCMHCGYCCCTLHTSVHTMYALLLLFRYTTHISTHYVCTVAIVAVHYTHQYTLCMHCCYCFGTLHTSVHTMYALLLLLLYTTHISTHYVCKLVIVTVHYTHQYTLCMQIGYCYCTLHTSVHTMYALWLLLLYTTHISTHYVCTVAIVAVHYTHQYTLCMHCGDCCCTLHISVHTMYALLLLLLNTTHISTHYVCNVAIVAVHYTHQYTLCMHCCYCFCTLHTSVHTMYALFAIVAVHYTHQYTLCMHCCYCCCTLHTSVHTMYALLLLLLYTTHISTHYVCTVAIVAVYYIHQYTLCMHCGYCCCTLHTSVHTIYALLLLLLYTTHISTHYVCTVAISCCALHTSVHTMYALLLLLLYTTHISTHYVCTVAIVAVHYTHQYTLCMHCCYCCCTLHTSVHTMYALWLFLLCITHISSHYVCIVAIVAVHYTHQYTLCMHCCYCCCTLHTSVYTMYALLLLLLCTTHISTHYVCIVAIVDCTYTYHVVYYKTIKHTKSCYYYWQCPCRVSYSLLLGLGNIAQENSTNQTNSGCLGGGSAKTSFGPGNSWAEARTPQPKQLNLALAIHCN